MRNPTFISSRTALLLSGSAVIGLCGFPIGSADAACTLVPTAGNDAFVCDSGTHTGDVLDLSGDNALTMPAGGTGLIDGNITFGPGVDTVEVHAGEIAGQLQQGDGVDDFTMTGGRIASLNQGGHFDTFFMSGGHIVGFFDDGDEAVMTGGRIGRVNMKLADNIFDMSGGIIDGNLVAGFGNDTITLSDGSIGGNISVSGGTDRVTVSGGTVGGDVRMSVGTDVFMWSGGGSIGGSVDLGNDDDAATLSNLTNDHIGETVAITGGPGTDDLTLENVATDGPARFQNWETVDAAMGTELTFSGSDMLTLGDGGTSTGVLNVDATSTLFGGGASGGIGAFDAGMLANVNNAGTIDLTNSGDSTTDIFTIAGDYVGNGAQLHLNTVLGDDSSASDKLVIADGNASGTTDMTIVNVGGSGAETVQDGIMVVETTGNGTTDPGAFALNNRVAVGAFEYYLFRGGVSGGTQENWYLRSTLVNPQTPTAVVPEPAPAPDPLSPADPDEPVTNPPPLPNTTTTVNPPTPDATPVTGEVVTLYRTEVPTYAVVPPVVHHLAFSTLGTFHERRGEQSLLIGGETYLPASWSRLFGQSAEIKWNGTVSPSFDGTLLGFQVGQDLYARETENGHMDRAGVFVSYARMNGDVKGQALGWNDLAVGDLDINGTSLGAYWTHIGPKGWYLDGVLMGTWFGGDTASRAGERIDIDGTGITASAETGYPVALSDRWTLEPQAQVIWQHLSLDDQSDTFSSIAFDADDAVTGRLGVRLQGNFPGNDGGMIKPYLKANLWHSFSAEQTLRFDGDPIVTEIDGTSLELGGGVVANLTDRVDLYATADYTTNLGGEKTEIFEGNLGLNISW
ncbi:autotransporter outer membrane beta-barrel domain-containing protein [uncultured Nitratireductor sp.]|uniref:autotransporter family protein n=1 Tax=uncultured Nitratireductor sp. TaxID=520953 RepID=UPI0025FD68B2|nr:autotransporter outer membrane beta-barrel domain-containing protein [uncultured Nitratireductor sp.]